MTKSSFKRLQKNSHLFCQSFGYDDDPIDRINYRISGLISVVAVIVIAIHGCLVQSTKCWTPQEFPSSWTEYADSYCSSNKVGRSALLKGMPQKSFEVEQTLNYQTWAWLFVVFLGVLYYLPRIIWKIMCRYFKTDLQEITNMVIQTSKENRTISKYDRQLMSSSYARLISGYLENAFSSRPNSQLQLSGYILGGCYIFIKLLYTASAVVHAYLIEVFVGTNYIMYGFDILAKVMAGETWNSSANLPEIRLCDFEVRKLGNNHLYSVQCIVPLNALLEKIFIVLWIWSVLLILANVYSLINWIINVFVLPLRTWVIRQQLLFIESAGSVDRSSINRFVENYLNADFMFLINLLSRNGYVFEGAQIINESWIRYYEKSKLKFDETMLNERQTLGISLSPM